jgi:hypothetical protein
VIGFSGRDPRTERAPGAENASQEGASFFPLARCWIRCTPGTRRRQQCRLSRGAVPACELAGVFGAAGMRTPSRNLCQAGARGNGRIITIDRARQAPGRTRWRDRGNARAVTENDRGTRKAGLCDPAIRSEPLQCGSGGRPSGWREPFQSGAHGANLAGAFLYGAQFLNCAQLIATRNWQSAFRDEELGCGTPIPERKCSK